MNPLVRGAATTAGTRRPRRGVEDRRVDALRRPGRPPAGPHRRPVAAHSVTANPSPTSRDTEAASRAGSPATGSNRCTASAGSLGPSGTGGIVVTGAGAARATGARRGRADAGRLPPGPPTPPRWRPASRPVRASSSRSCTPRSRIRRGSTRNTWPAAGNRSGRTRSVDSTKGSHDSMPSNCSPRARRSHIAVPHGRRAGKRSAADRSASVRTSSRQP